MSAPSMEDHLLLASLDHEALRLHGHSLAVTANTSARENMPVTLLVGLLSTFVSY
jgi:hypothetical protein